MPPSCSLFCCHSAPLVLWESSRPWRSATSLLPRAGPRTSGVAAPRRAALAGQGAGCRSATLGIMATIWERNPYLTDEQVARIRGAAVPQPGRRSVAGRRAGHTQPTREAEADAILAANKAIKKVAKARQLCPVFDAKCREKDCPRRLRERLAYARLVISRTPEIANSRNFLSRKRV